MLHPLVKAWAAEVTFPWFKFTVPTCEMTALELMLHPLVKAWAAEVTFPWFKFMVPTFEMQSPLELMSQPLVKAWSNISWLKLTVPTYEMYSPGAHVTPAGKGGMLKYQFLDSSLRWSPMKFTAVELIFHPLVKVVC